MSVSSLSSLSSYTSESDLSTIFGIGLFKSSRPRRRSDRKRSPSPPRRKQSITPTRTPVSSSRYDGVVVPYSLRSPGSKSGISYSDIDRWRTATVGGSDFTYSSESSVTQSSVTSSSVVSSSSRSSRFKISTRRAVASSSRQLQATSVPTHRPHSGIHFDPPQICEHCRKGCVYPLSPRSLMLSPTSHRPPTEPSPWANGCPSSSPTGTSFRFSRCLPPLPDFLS